MALHLTQGLQQRRAVPGMQTRGPSLSMPDPYTREVQYRQ